ncbi:response regulator [Fibrivirga algicola]|uniref:Response regulator n=1 Tax=Fibrivirga algicola TaxID=2950420 RepID=A0ABX0QR64_9BACT|nr:response regulator [Fibrivirga algicola]NID13462.1 response regulator [Fibrivirga algicola]
MVSVDLMRHVHLWARFYIAYSVIRKWIKDSIINHERMHAARLYLARRQVNGSQLTCTHPSNELLVWVVYDDQQEHWSHQSDQFRPDSGQAKTLPKVILLDLNMQRQSGRETLQGLQATIAYYRLSIVVLTTSNAQLDDKMSMGLGAKSFLIKPVKKALSVKMLEGLALKQHLKLH